MKVCSVPGCGRKHCAKGFCNNHYAKYRRTFEYQLAHPPKPKEWKMPKNTTPEKINTALEQAKRIVRIALNKK